MFKSFMTNPTFVMLVGLPASGKTTFRDMVLDYGKPVYYVLSTDDKIEEAAAMFDSTYTEMFTSNIKFATKQMWEDFDFSIEREWNILHDQTNVTAEKRRSVLLKIPSNYYKVAVNIECSDAAEWNLRLANRPGKDIPADVIRVMVSSATEATLKEGFDQVFYYDSSSSKTDTI